MIEFFKNGGFGMFPVLILGLVALATAAHYAWRKDARARGFLDLSARSLVFFSITAFFTDVAATFDYLLKHQLTGDQRTATLIEGLRESLSPVILGGALLALLYVLVAVGQRRIDARVDLA